MDYFYAPPEKISRDTVEIDGEEFAHLVHVMRKKEGDGIRVVDGSGTAFDVILSAIRKKSARGRIIARYQRFNEPEISLTLAVGVLKNPSKFDFLVEKVTELGAREIIPMTTARTIGHHAKTERWQKLALSAMKQCGRSVLPRVHEIRPFGDVLASAKSYTFKFVCHDDPKGTQSMTSLLNTQLSGKKEASALVVIGPEGGLSDDEVSSCVKAGCAVGSLGPRRLRTETAAICAAALVLQA